MQDKYTELTRYVINDSGFFHSSLKVFLSFSLNLWPYSYFPAFPAQTQCISFTARTTVFPGVSVGLHTAKSPGGCGQRARLSLQDAGALTDAARSTIGIYHLN